MFAKKIIKIIKINNKHTTNDILIIFIESRVVSPCLNLSLDATLDMFIDLVSKTWREDLVRGTFLPFEANKTLGIPISLDGDADELCWVYSKDEVLYVKDVYSIALNSTEVASCSKVLDPLWSMIWKLKVPTKVRDFVWRACWDIIPHGVNISKNGIKDYLSCLRCGKDESLLHMLRDCSWVHDVWKVVDFSFPSLSFGSFRDVLDCVGASHGQASVERFVVICWNVWKARNEVIYERVSIPPSLCVGRAIYWLAECHFFVS